LSRAEWRDLLVLCILGMGICGAFVYVGTIGTILIVVIVPGLGTYLGYARIQRAPDASTTALILYLVTVYTALMAWLLLEESLELYHLVGAILILPGIFLSNRKYTAR
jgi:drug/metabolite transporter (DMT)-like permease